MEDETKEEIPKDGTPEAEAREARIYADVFRPDETDLEYFLRRGRELEAKQAKKLK